MYPDMQWLFICGLVAIPTGVDVTCGGGHLVDPIHGYGSSMSIACPSMSWPTSELVPRCPSLTPATSVFSGWECGIVGMWECGNVENPKVLKRKQTKPPPLPHPQGLGISPPPHVARTLMVRSLLLTNRSLGGLAGASGTFWDC